MKMTKYICPEDSTDSDSVNDEEYEECYDKLEELLILERQV